MWSRCCRCWPARSRTTKPSSTPPRPRWPTAPPIPPRRSGCEAIDEFAAEEIGAALCLTRRAADSHLGLALDLFERLPQVGHALLQGRIDLARARVICESTSHLEETEARRVADSVLEQAEDLTTGQLGARVRRLALSVQPEEAARRYQAAVEERRVMCLPNADGTADLVACNLPAERAVACMRSLDAAGPRRQAVGGSPQHRPVAHRPSLGPPRGGPLHQAPPWGGRPPHRSHHPRRARLQSWRDPRVRADRRRRGPAGGRQPAPLGVAGHRDRPESGLVAWNGITRRRPNLTQRRYLEARNRRCVFPGCRMPAIDSRHRPHQGLRPGRIDRRHQPRTAVSSPSSVEARGGVATGADRTRRLPLDQSTRTRLHRGPGTAVSSAGRRGGHAA